MPTILPPTPSPLALIAALRAIAADQTRLRDLPEESLQRLAGEAARLRDVVERALMERADRNGESRQC
jgi:hypothetical protein